MLAFEQALPGGYNYVCNLLQEMTRMTENVNTLCNPVVSESPLGEQ